MTAIHLAVAVPMMLQLEWREAEFLRSRPMPMRLQPQPALAEGEERVSFNPCTLWGKRPAQQEIVAAIDFPVIALTGWRFDCTWQGSLAARLEADWEHRTVESQQRLDLAVLALISVQWLLVGGLPLVKPRRGWTEPGKVLTGGAVASALLTLVPGIGSAAMVPALLAWFAWWWWLGLLIWRLVRAVLIPPSARPAPHPADRAD